jgi:hypothetical protein
MALPPVPPVDDLLDDVTVEEYDDGSVDVVFPDDEEDAIDEDYMEGYYTEGFFENLVDKFSPEELSKIAREVIDSSEADDESRAEWTDTIQKGLNLLGLRIEEDSGLFEGACAAYHPLILENAVKYQSKASSELLPAGGPVKTQIIGKVTDEKELQAARVKDFMNYDITVVMEDFSAEIEKLLFVQAIMGSGFTKTYYNMNMGRKVTEFVSPDQVIVPYNITDLRKCYRFTHRILKDKNDLIFDMHNGLYKKYSLGPTKSDETYEVEVDADETLGPPVQYDLTPVQNKINQLLGLCNSNDEGYILLEQHVHKNFKSLAKQDGEEVDIPLPYVITVDKASLKVLSIRRNWKEGDKKYKRKQYFTHWPFVPGFGFYGLGYLHLLGNFNLTLTTILRSLVDAGMFANMQGGFKVKGLKIIGGNDPIAPGEFKDIEASGIDLDKAIKPLPYKEPSQTLYQLLEFIESRGQKFADSTEQVIADSTNYGPVGTTLALLEASTKFFSAIHKRLHNSMKQVLRIHAELNHECLPEEYPFEVIGGERTIFRKDFDGGVDIIPVSDPNSPSQAHRTAIAQTRLSLAQAAPQIHDLREAYKDVYIGMGIEQNLEKILPKPEEAIEQDPVSDLMAASAGKPIKAFPGQDHDAHMQIKMNFLNDPTFGGNPAAQSLLPLIQANITEHLMLKYQESIAAMAQSTPPDQAKGLAAITIASSQLAQQGQQLAQIAEQGGLEDPARIIANAEVQKVQVEKERVDSKLVADLGKLALDQQKLDLEYIKEANKNEQFKDELKVDLTKEAIKARAQSTKDAVSKMKKESED